MTDNGIDYGQVDMPGWLVPVCVTLSLLGAAFLLWLIYGREPVAGHDVAFLGGVNALLNGCATLCLLAGYRLIRRGRWRMHRNVMLMALLFSALFLVSYLIYHTFHGDSRFLGQGAIRPVYFFILISHIVLSVVALPLILVTVSLSLTRRFALHRKWARWAFPVWTYVSVTGVAVYCLLKAFGSGPPIG